jgi:outer membrane protein assembly factor BamA
MHAGRYGRDADNPRLTELYVGYATLVRGYASNSFSLSECDGGREGDCPEFDRLVGTKIGVANLELRLPFLGTEDFGMFNFPYLPTEILGFVDGGVAWTNAERPRWEFDRNGQERVPVFSTGMAARVNVLGALIVEAYYAFPLQRPERSGGIFGVQIVPGW